MADDAAVQDLLEHNRIAGVINTVFLSTDAREWARVKECFARTVTFDMTSLAGGSPQEMSPDEIVSGWQAGLKPIEKVHHQWGNLTIACTGAEATASCYGIAYHHRRTATGKNTSLAAMTFIFGSTDSGASICFDSISSSSMAMWNWRRKRAPENAAPSNKGMKLTKPGGARVGVGASQLIPGVRRLLEGDAGPADPRGSIRQVRLWLR
jgi:hypothetical protein